MRQFKFHQGKVVPLDRANVDTDQIIPKQFLKSIKRSGFGPNLFDAWRYLDSGEPGMDNSKRPRNPDFVLNQPRYQGGSILLARENFGCGSSREHAPWALDDYGFRVIIAPGFADIFYNNCFKNGLLPVRLEEGQVDQLFALAADPATDPDPDQQVLELKVNLQSQTIELPDSSRFDFEIDAFAKHCLLEGLDEIGLTLQHAQAIRDYESKRITEAPWLFTSM